MSGTVLSKIYPPPVIDRTKILRFAACPHPNEETLELLEEGFAKLQGKLSYKVCFATYPLFLETDRCCFDGWSVESKDLVRHLSGCSAAVLFAATVGVELDRTIHRYSRLSPSLAVMLQAIGAERIEALCDTFCKEIETERGTVTERFSPGYGDLPLSTQGEILRRLDAARRIGVTLTDRFMMLPTKSVTAFVGIKEETR